MLPPTHYQPYRALRQTLEPLQQIAGAPSLEGDVLKERFQDVRELYHNQIVTLSSDDLAPDTVSRWQSLQTEIHKQMRLLETDVMLLQASRSSATTQARQGGMRDRINTLMQYCEALLQL